MPAAVTYRSMMNPSDAIIWHIEDDPQLRSTIVGVWELESAPAADRLRESIERMVSAIPRMRQRVLPGSPRPRWVDVAFIDIDQHYRKVALNEGATFADAVATAEKWVRRPFDRTRPLWEFGLLTGLADGKAAVIIKVHHAIADGIGLVLMLAAFTDIEPNPSERFVPDQLEHDEPSTRPAWSRRRRLAHRLRLVWKSFSEAPRASAEQLVATLASAGRVVWPSRVPHSKLMTGRSGELHLDHRAIPMRALKEAARAAGVSVNDAFVSIVADGVARYHDHHGAACEQLRLHVPVNVRNQRTASLAGNQFVPARLSMRMLRRDSPHLFSHVKAQLDRLRAEPALPHINTIGAAVLRLGKRPTQWILGGMMKGVDVLASNVPGPNFPLYLAGVRVNDFVAFGPPAGAALNVTLFSYRSSVYFGISTDAAAIPDREVLLECFDAALAERVGQCEPALADA